MRKKLTTITYYVYHFAVKQKYLNLRFSNAIASILSVLFLTACESDKNYNNHKGKIINENNVQEYKRHTFVIQPIGYFSNSTLKLIAARISKICPGSVVTAPAIKPPNNSLNLNKTRHRADTLIKFLGSKTEANKTSIGVTNLSISKTKGNIADYGIFGLSFCPGNACVISSFSIKGKNKIEKFYKVVLHEIAHTQGLQHCAKKNCFMRDAKGRDHLNEEVGFCKSCKGFLLKKGWKL